MTAAWLEPESNQTSIVSVSLVNEPQPHSHLMSSVRMSSASISNQALVPCARNRSATSLMVFSLTIGLPHCLQKKIGMGTPQVRWREMHQSERS